MRKKVILGSILLNALILINTNCSVYAFNNLSTITYPYYAFIEDPDSPWTSVWDALDATGTIEYSDEFFDEPSPGIHPELRAASYALSLAGFENQADGYPAVSVNHKLYTMLDELGFSEPESWDTISDPDGHSMGTTVAHKTLNNGQNLVVVVPRSYNYMTEWLSNFNVGITDDHAGLSEAAGLITARLEQYITSHSLENNKIWIVGYSRGGGTVDLAAKAINQNIANYNTTANDLYVYTFGAPKASMEETQYVNIHDVKDGNDLLLGYLFPDQWGFHNTGTYEGIHDADLSIETYAINISDLADSAKVVNILANNDGLTSDLGAKNAKVFMDEWLEFVTTHGLTREYFDTVVKPPLSNIMQALQLRTVDKQSEFTNFLSDTDRGMLAIIAKNAFIDLTNNIEGDTLEEKLANYPPYQYIVKTLKGTATSDEIHNLAETLKEYLGEYSEYETSLGTTPPITEDEFNIIKENIPKLVEAFGPLLVADAKYTQEAYGEENSLYYTYTLISNFNNLVYAHIPESIMPILKAAIEPEFIPVPDTGSFTEFEGYAKSTNIVAMCLGAVFLILISVFYNHKKSA